MEQRALKRRRRRVALAVVALLVLAVVARSALRYADARESERARPTPAAAAADSAPRRAPPPDARAPQGVRIKVEVLNATTVRGLARRATEYLRDRGFDVVQVGTVAARERRDSTLVLDRSGHAGWARLVGLAMGAPVVARPDSTHYVDVTILLGRDWSPPAQPFYP